MDKRKSNKNVPPPAITMTPEMAQQFESELCWCIQQIQSSLKSEKLNNKQADEHRKSLNTLMNNSTSIVKKRQVMRLLFGDYRAKMAEEEKKLSKAHGKVTIKPVEPNKKSVFVKKALPSNLTDFKFNFDVQSDSVTNNLSKIELNDGEERSVENLKKKFKFVPSQNDFKFKFCQIEES
ncbi:hypothetical protein HHI36_020899 [Cryptolaemus montrouzieri]|uniref:Uncharacterized protein n=1 Tax=Cryptolaemus montrouzieri TaxID=559131 RepID=A0ABD2NBX0_9CUCU